MVSKQTYTGTSVKTKWLPKGELDPVICGKGTDPGEASKVMEVSAS